MSKKLKKCPNCSQLFTLKSLPSKQNSDNIPLFLKCGHSICENCIKNLVKFSEPIECKVCHKNMEIPENDLILIRNNTTNLHQLFPVNIYMLGELSLDLLLETKFEYKNEDEEYFINIGAIIQNTETSEGQCLECSNQTTKMCQQCATILCESCFNKSHKNFVIFKNHKLQNIEPQLPLNKCEVHFEKTLDYYCKDCSKSICMNCLVVSGEKSCKNHNLVSIQEENEHLLDELAEISPKVEETYKRLTKTAVDVGYTLHNIINDTETTDLTKITNEIEQKFSQLMCIIQSEKEKVYNLIIEEKNAEKESLESFKNSLPDLIKRAKSVLTAVNNSLSVEKIKQTNMSVLLEDAKRVVNSPWYFRYTKPSIKIIVNEELGNLLADFIRIEIENVGTYQILATADLDPSIEIPPPPSAPVYPPELPKDVRKQKQKEPKLEKKDFMKNSFYKAVPTYRTKSGSVSSLNSLNSESSYKSSRYKDDNYSTPVVQTVSPFFESHQPKQLYAGSQELVYISHIVTPHNFFVQRLCHQVKVEELLKEFRNAVSLPTPSISHIAEGKFYLVFNKTDNLWQRGQIISIDRKEVEKPVLDVFCIDFGSIVVVTIDKLRLIPPARVQSPSPFAINCSLSNCEPLAGAWTSDDAFLMQNITNNKQAVIHIHRIHSTPKYTVSIECDVTTFEYGMSLAHALVFHGRARLINPKAPYPKNMTVVDKPKLFITNNDFKSKTVEEVFLIHIVSPDNFFVRKQHLQKVYENLCEELEQNYTLGIDMGTIYLPEIGMVCVVNLDKYDVPDANMNETRTQWARAIVKELPGRGRVRLLLPDCGATLLAHWSALRHIQPKFTTLRALATECHLAGVTPLNKKWSPNSVVLLQSFRDRLLDLHVEDNRNRSLGVTLYDKTDAEKVICINNEMVKYKFAVSFGMFMLHKENIIQDQVITNISPFKKEKPKPTNSTMILKKKTETPTTIYDKGDQLEAKDKGPLRLEAKVLNYQSPSSIYITFVHQQKTLKTIFENMQKYYSKKKTCSKTNWKIGDKCCTLCHQSQTWRRAAIVEIDGENAKVFYSDFACVETVPISSLKELTPDFLSISYAAIKCHLSGVIPADGEDWPSLTKEYLKEMLDAYKRVFITKVGNFKENSMPVEMWVYHTTQGNALEPNISEWRCLNNKIIEQGLGIPDKSRQTSATACAKNKTDENTLSFLNVTGSVEEWLQLEPLPRKSLIIKSDSGSHSGSSTPEFEVNSNTDHKTDEVSISDWMPPEPLKSLEFTGVPTYVDNDGIIYLHEISQRDTLDLIRKALDVRFNNPDPKAKYAKWAVGEPCIALYYLDNKFYRGRIIEVNNEASTCLVHYIDYGNEENCSFSNLRKSIALYQIPIQALKCVLNRIQPIRKYWDRRTLDYLHKSIVEKQCLVKISKEAIDGIHAIELKYNKLWINDHLVEFEMAKYSNGSKAVIRKFAPANVKRDIVEYSSVVESDSGPDYIVEDDEEADISFSNNSYKLNSLEEKDWNQILLEEEDNHSTEKKYMTFKNIDDDYFECNITVINNFSILELNILHNEEIMEQYEHMFEKLQDSANNMTCLDGIFENKACVAIFSDDGRWYRASILEYSDETNRIKVRYVDYGNIEIISLAEAREIDEEFIKLPPLSIQATLHYVQVSPNVEIGIVTKEFKNTFLDKGPFYAHVINKNNKILSVELKNKSGELIYNHLIENNILLAFNVD